MTEPVQEHDIHAAILRRSLNHGCAAVATICEAPISRTRYGAMWRATADASWIMLGEDDTLEGLLAKLNGTQAGIGRF